MRNVKARAEKQWVRDAITIHLFEKLPDGRISLLSNLEFTTIDPMVEVQPGQSIDLPITTAQELMDELWSCGLRPSEGSGSAGALKATETHLKDMQDFSRRLLGMVETRLLTQRAADDGRA